MANRIEIPENTAIHCTTLGEWKVVEKYYKLDWTRDEYYKKYRQDTCITKYGYSPIASYRKDGYKIVLASEFLNQETQVEIFN